MELRKALSNNLREHHNPLQRAEAAKKLQGHKDDSSYMALVAALDDPHLAAIAAVVAPLIVKKFIVPATEELCLAWEEAMVTQK